MTEEEAKTMACCGGVATAWATIATAYAAAGHAELVPEAPRCVGSKCMAWRWSEPKRTAAFLEAVQRHMQAQSKPNFNTAVQAVYAETGGQFTRSEGHCGLAGTPQ